MKLNIAVLGYGYWGPNLVRNFAKFKNCNVSYIVDKDIDNLKKAQQIYPNIKCICNPLVAIKDKNIDAIVITLPVSQHYKYAKLALKNNKHLLIEKPATGSKEKFKELVELSKKNKLTLMVDFTFLYTPAVKKIKELIDNNFIGDILFFNASRVNGIYRKDINIIGDLSIHDISIMQYLLNETPKKIYAFGISSITNNIEDMVNIELQYKKVNGHIFSSWVFPFRQKQLIICGSKKTIVYNDIEPVEKIKVYNSVYDILNRKKSKIINYNDEKYYTPKLGKKEALESMCKDFISSILKGTNPIANKDFALEINCILDSCNKFMYIRKNNEK